MSDSAQIAELLDQANALVKAIEDETQALEARTGGVRVAVEQATRKKAMADAFDGKVAKLDRDWPNWKDEVQNGLSDRLTMTMAKLSSAAGKNAKILERHVAFSREMLQHVEAEMKRASSGQFAVYGQNGGSTDVRRHSPIALDRSC